MKTNRLFIFGLLCVLCLTACETPVIEPERDTTLRIEASTDSVNCDPQLADKDALQLAWTAGTNHGTGSAIAYTLDIDFADNAFAQAAQIEIGRTTDRTLMLSHRQLSDTLCKYFPQTEVGVLYRFAIRVRAKVVMTDEELVSEPIYVVISRLAQRVQIVLPDPMREIDCLPSLEEQTALRFSWSGASDHGTGSAIAYTVDMAQDSLFANGLHWPTDTTFADWSHRALYDLLNSHFAPMTQGESYTYYIRVRATLVETNDVQYSYAQPIVIRQYQEGVVPLYLVGDATPNGWSCDNATLMISTWHGHLNRGEFKLLVSTGDFYPCYVRDPADETKMLYKEHADGGPEDLKWNIYYPGEYTISANIATKTISIQEQGGNETYKRIYMMGDATPGGWSLDQLTELNHPQKYIFTYRGHLNAGEIKFPSELHPTDYDGVMLYAPTANCAPTENGTFDIHSGNPDNKWLIPTAGEWNITINMQNQSISFVKL